MSMQQLLEVRWEKEFIYLLLNLGEFLRNLQQCNVANVNAPHEFA